MTDEAMGTQDNNDISPTVPVEHYCAKLVETVKETLSPIIYLTTYLFL